LVHFLNSFSSFLSVIATVYRQLEPLRGAPSFPPLSDIAFTAYLNSIASEHVTVIDPSSSRPAVIGITRMSFEGATGVHVSFSHDPPRFLTLNGARVLSEASLPVSGDLVFAYKTVPAFS
jgi:hypothetical protein